METKARNLADAIITPAHEPAPSVSHTETLRKIQQIIEQVDCQALLVDAVEIACQGLQALVEADKASFNATDPVLRRQLDMLDPGRGSAPSQGATDNERLLVMPVAHPDGHSLGEFTARRDSEATAFNQSDVWATQQLAYYLAGPFARLSLAGLLEQHAREDAGLNDAPIGIYRRKAIERHAEAVTRPGEPLRLSPAWIRGFYPVLLACLLAGLAYICLARVTEYVAGPAVVQLQGVQEVTAAVGGSVGAVLVTAGTVVERGQPLVRFYNAGEQTELRRLQQAFELELIKRLSDPNDPATARTLTQLRAQLNAAQAALNQRSVYAPAPGVVVDVRARSGQVYQPGQVLLSLAVGDGRPMVTALIPGSYRPQLAPGMPLRLALQGYPYAYQELVVEAIGKEVVGPEVARRYLGTDIASAVQLSGPVIPVRAMLPQRHFSAGGKRYQYYDGMLATAEVGVDSQRLLFALFPGLEQLTDGS